VRVVRSLEVWLRIPLDVWIFLTVSFMVAVEIILALNTGTVLHPWANALVEFKISFDAVENSNDGTTSTKLETVGVSLSLSISFLLFPLWSTGHLWNAFFHFSFLILRQSAGLLGRVISSSQGRCLHKHKINADRHPCLEWDSNPRAQCSSGRRKFMP
jgi:hypothetical protein